jgi:hypothetical protein
MKRLVIVALAGILLIGVAAVAIVLWAGGGDAPAPSAPGAAPGQGTGLAGAAGASGPSGPAVPVQGAPGPVPPRSEISPVNSQVEIEVGSQPPKMSKDPEERTEKLLEVQERRREDGIDQLNAREADRRKRLGLPPVPSPTASPGGRPAPPIQQ